jgi:hypothetical protein
LFQGKQKGVTDLEEEREMMRWERGDALVAVQRGLHAALVPHLVRGARGIM